MIYLAYPFLFFICCLLVAIVAMIMTGLEGTIAIISENVELFFLIFIIYSIIKCVIMQKRYKGNTWDKIFNFVVLSFTSVLSDTIIVMSLCSLLEWYRSQTFDYTIIDTIGMLLFGFIYIIIFGSIILFFKSLAMFVPYQTYCNFSLFQATIIYGLLACLSIIIAAAFVYITCYKDFNTLFSEATLLRQLFDFCLNINPLKYLSDTYGWKF